MSPGAEVRSSDASTPPATTAARKPRFALFVATAGGLGYLPKAPGTWGSLAGLLLAVAPLWAVFAINLVSDVHVNLSIKHAANIFLGVFTSWSQVSGSSLTTTIDPVLLVHVLVAIATAGIGIWAATRAAQFWQQKDPQRVVIDEVSGQHLTLLLGLAIPVWWKPTQTVSYDYMLGFVSFHSVLSWKYLRLEQQVKALKTDPDAIEREARDRLHYARPGEVIWTEDEPQGAAKPKK